MFFVDDGEFVAKLFDDAFGGVNVRNVGFKLDLMFEVVFGRDFFFIGENCAGVGFSQPQHGCFPVQQAAAMKEIFLKCLVRELGAEIAQLGREIDDHLFINEIFFFYFNCHLIVARIAAV